MKPVTIARFSAPIIIFDLKKKQWSRVMMNTAAANFTLSIRDITERFPGGRIELNATVGYHDKIFMINVPKWDMLELLRVNLMLRPITRQSKKNIRIEAPDLLKDLVPPEQYPLEVVEKIWREYKGAETRRIKAAFEDPASREVARIQLEALDRRREVIEAVYPILPSGR